MRQFRAELRRWETPKNLATNYTNFTKHQRMIRSIENDFVEFVEFVAGFF